jgi:regulator of protease activity HflC (stomatin/prohibitin superfamily)
MNKKALFIGGIIIGIPIFLQAFSFGSSLLNQRDDFSAFAGWAVIILCFSVPILLGLRVSIRKKSAESASIGLKKGSIQSVLCLALLIGSLTLTGCTRVDPGHVGIKVNMVGGQRGVQDIPIVTGIVLFNPVTESVFTFPTTVQTENWVASKEEGKPVDESVTFNSIEGAVVNADIALTYSFEANKVPYLFNRFRKSPEDLSDKFLRSRVRDRLNENAAKMRIVDIFGSGKQELLIKTRDDLRRELGPQGFVIETVSFVNGLRVSRDVMNSINSVITATQNAISAENKVREIKAIAVQDSIRAAGQARALAINPRALEWRVVEKWNGVLPLSTGGSAIVNLPATTAVRASK